MLFCSEECQLTKVEEMQELEKHYFVPFNTWLVQVKDHQWMSKQLVRQNPTNCCILVAVLWVFIVLFQLSAVLHYKRERNSTSPLGSIWMNNMSQINTAMCSLPSCSPFLPLLLYFHLSGSQQLLAKSLLAPWTDLLPPHQRCWQWIWFCL